MSKITGIPIALALAATILACGAARACEVIVFRDAKFEGQKWTSSTAVSKMDDNWNDQISSIVVISGTWNFYQDWYYKGPSFQLKPGEYSYVGDKWNDRISSFRCVNE